MNRKKNLRRLSVLVTAQTLYNLQKLADMAGSRDVGRVVDKLTREKMLAMKDSCHHPPEAIQNEPLTLEQLREMDGEPVWIANPDALGYGRWGIVDGVYQAEDDQVLMLRGDYSCHYYGKTWLAYRRPPEGEHHHG